MTDWNTMPAYRRDAPTDRWRRMGPQQRALFLQLLELERPPRRRRGAILAAPAGPAPVPRRQSTGARPAMRTARRPDRSA